jgi:hypothetical protein
MHKNATKCNKTLSKWCKNKHGASKIIDTLETYQATPMLLHHDASIQIDNFGIGHGVNLMDRWTRTLKS